MWIDLALGVLVLLALAQLVLLLRGRRQLQELRRRIDLQALDAAYACTDVPTSMLVASLGRLERQLSRLEQQPAQERQSYEMAQQLARQGADVEQLVSRCGLSREEAKLVLQMHPANP